MYDSMDKVYVGEVMDIITTINKSSDEGRKALSAATLHPFYKVLARLGLNEDSLGGQSFEELEKRLETLDLLIRLNSDTTPPIGNTEVRVILLRLKAIVIDHLRAKSSENQLVKIVSNARDETQDELKNQILMLVDSNSKSQEIILQLEQERKKAQDNIDKKTTEREAFKEPWAIRQSLLAKESVSTILGALLLFIIVICLIVTTFTHVATPQILNDGFLVLLGYFFGQTAANASKRDKNE